MASYLQLNQYSFQEPPPLLLFHDPRAVRVQLLLSCLRHSSQMTWRTFHCYRKIPVSSHRLPPRGSHSLQPWLDLHQSEEILWH